MTAAADVALYAVGMIYGGGLGYLVSRARLNYCGSLIARQRARIDDLECALEAKRALMPAGSYHVENVSLLSGDTVSLREIGTVSRVDITTSSATNLRVMVAS